MRKKQLQQISTLKYKPQAILLAVLFEFEIAEILEIRDSLLYNEYI